MTKEELIKANKAYRADLTREVDDAQEEIIRLAKKALVAGSIALVISAIRNAFFVKGKKKNQYKSVEDHRSFLSKEVSELIILEMLKLTKVQLRKFLEKQSNENG